MRPPCLLVRGDVDVRSVTIAKWWRASSTASAPGSRGGTWDNALTRLLADADASGEIDWAVSIDSTTNRTHQHAATLPRTAGGTGESHESGRAG